MKEALSRNTAREGSALLVVVCYLAAITIFASTFLSFLNRTVSDQRRTEIKQVTLNIAEAGVDKALAELRTRPADYRGETNISVGKGSFSVEVEPGDRRGEYRIISTAEVTNGKLVLSRTRVAANAVLSGGGAVRELRWSEVKRW